MSKIADRLKALDSAPEKAPFATDPHETVVRVRADRRIQPQPKAVESQFRFNWSGAERTVAQRLVEDAGYGASIAGLLRAAIRVADANPEFRAEVVRELKASM
jgi:hypothetical protein